MDLTHPSRSDEALRRLIDQPTYSAQVLIVMARILEMDRKLPLTDTVRRQALDISIYAVLGTLPPAVRHDSLDRVRAVMPDMADCTRGQAAVSLRTAANNLGTAARYGRAAAKVDGQVRTMLLEMAGRLETHRPDEPLTTAARIALIQATTMAPPLARALRDQAPEIVGPVIRRDYAAQLREIAGGS